MVILQPQRTMNICGTRRAVNFCPVDTSNSDTWDLSVLYQDAAADLVDSEPSEADSASAASARPRQFRGAAPERSLNLAEIDTALTYGDRLSRASKSASLTPLVRHAPHHPYADVAHRHEHSTPRAAGERVKRVLDIVGALALAIVLSPLLIVVAVVLARNHGSVIYSHPRTGRYGKTFGCLKFRTMVPNAEQVLTDLFNQNPSLRLEWMRDHKLRDDPRVTRIGRFLRRTSLDELPQLWNVLKGDMSLVGPRPVVRDELQRYGRRLEMYLTAKPGVTGLWQVMGRSNTCYRRRVALDTYYVRKRSLLLDLYILLRTVKVVLRGNGAC
jgi:lipopolysaccharide/colanic/teichoic acid biosynthesis glycosyltransferase